MINRRGLPPVRIRSGLISRCVCASPLAMVQRRRHSSVSSGSRATMRNSSKNGCAASSSPLNRLVAVASSITWGSDCSVFRSCQPKSSSTSLHRACRFSTMRTSFRPMPAAASRTAARAHSSMFVSRHRAVRSACVEKSSRDNSGLPLAIAWARWNSASSQKSAIVVISWLSSMNRTGNRRSDSAASVRNSASTRASNMVFPRPRDPTISACWHDGESMLPRKTSSTRPSSRCLTTNCLTTSSSDWNVPGLNLRIG